MSGAERRIWARKTISIFLPVSTVEGNVLGRALDISAGGMLIMHLTPMSVGDRLSILLTMPPEMELPEPLCLDALIRWTDSDMPREYYKSGLEFLNVTPEKIEIMNHFSEKYTQEGGPLIA